MNLKFTSDGRSLTPQNWKETTFELDFTSVNPSAVLKPIKFTFVNDEAAYIYSKIITGGLSGGTGIYEGLPFKIEADNVVFFNGCLDLVNGAEIGCRKITCNIVESGKIDWLNDIADSFSFSYLYSKGFITKSHFKNIPYIISTIPNYQDTLILSISLFIMTKELKEAIRKTSDIIAETAGVFTTPVGIAKLAFQILYLIAIVAAIIKLINDLFSSLIQFTKYHKGMLVIDLVNASCNKLGLTLSSTILQTAPFNMLAILPEKYQKGKKLINLGNDKQMGYMNGTFGDLLRALTTKFNLKIVLKNNILYIERRDYFKKQSTYIVPDVRNDFYGVNADEIASNYLIQFQVDTLETNTVENYNGTNVNIITEPKVIKNKQNVLLKNLELKEIPFALAKRKTSLTEIEQFFNVIIHFVGGIIDFINSITGNSSSVANMIENRIGMLLLSQDQVNVPKIMLLTTDNKLPVNNSTYVNASYLWYNYHYINSFVPKSNVTALTLYKNSGADYPENGYQNYLYSIENVPFCISDFNKVSGNNFIKTKDNKNGEIDSIEFNPSKETANIKYRINQKFTNNLGLNIIINTGE